MSKSRWSVIRRENIITIKKKADAGACFIVTLIMLSGIILPILLDLSENAELFWVAYGVCMLMNIAWFLSIFLGKIVIDTEKRELSIYNLCRETYRFEEITEVKSFYDPGDGDGGPDRSKVVFLFANGRRSELETASREQAEELITLLRGVMAL